MATALSSAPPPLQELPQLRHPNRKPAQLCTSSGPASHSSSLHGDRHCCHQGAGELLSLHCLKAWARAGSSWELGNCFLQSTDLKERLLTPFPEGRRTRGLVRTSFHVGLAQGSLLEPPDWLPSLWPPPPSGELHHAPGFPPQSVYCIPPPLLHYAFPSAGINLALNECRKNTWKQTQTKQSSNIGLAHTQLPQKRSKSSHFLVFCLSLLLPPHPWMALPFSAFT